MKSKAPPDRRKFADDRDEMDYLYHKLLYWLYERGDRMRARAFAERLRHLLRRLDLRHESIFGEECWSLVYEAKGISKKAIECRENEIRLIRRLHEISCKTGHQDTAWKLYGHQDLSDRLDLLAALYHDAGMLARAVETLEESRRLCAEHGIRFDARDMLQEYQQEYQSRQQIEVRKPPAVTKRQKVS